MFTTLLVLFYLLVSGETFLRRMVEILPRFNDKRQAVELSMHIERDVSAYLLTVTCINAAGRPRDRLRDVGVRRRQPCAVGRGRLRAELRADPGPDGRDRRVPDGERPVTRRDLVGTAAGRPLFRHPHRRGRGRDADAAGPPVHHQSGGGDPGADFLVLDVGCTGAILAVPLLAVTKIICDDLRPLRAFGHLLEG